VRQVTRKVIRIGRSVRPEDVYAHVHRDDVADVLARVRHAVDAGGTSNAEYRTDGLVERRDKDVDSDIDRLQASLADLAGRDLDELCDAVLAWMLPPRADDEVALIAVRLHCLDAKT
jgi:hypothetical protein